MHIHTHVDMPPRIPTITKHQVYKTNTYINHYKMLSFNIFLIASVFAFPMMDKTIDAQPSTAQTTNDDQEPSNDENVDSLVIKDSQLPEIHATGYGSVYGTQ
jgi:hypothetical protein